MCATESSSGTARAALGHFGIAAGDVVRVTEALDALAGVARRRTFTISDAVVAVPEISLEVASLVRGIHPVRRTKQPRCVKCNTINANGERKCWRCRGSVR